MKRSHTSKGTSGLAGLPKNHQMIKNLGFNGVFCLFKVLGIQSLSSAVRPCGVVIGSLWKRQNEWKILHSTNLYLIIAKFLLEYPLGASVEERGLRYG